MNRQSPSPSSSSQQHAQQIPQYAAGPDLATHFDDPFLSDFQLALVTPEKVELARFNVHGIVLAGQSGYFKSLLQNWMGAEARVFSITITDDELPAAKHMLQCAYSNSMPPDADAQQLLATMILADRCGGDFSAAGNAGQPQRAAAASQGLVGRCKEQRQCTHAQCMQVAAAAA